MTDCSDVMTPRTGISRGTCIGDVWSTDRLPCNTVPPPQGLCLECRFYVMLLMVMHGSGTECSSSRSSLGFEKFAFAAAVIGAGPRTTGTQRPSRLIPMESLLARDHSVGQTSPRVRRRPPWWWWDRNKRVFMTVPIGGMLSHVWCRASKCMSCVRVTCQPRLMGCQDASCSVTSMRSI